MGCNRSKLSYEDVTKLMAVQLLYPGFDWIARDERYDELYVYGDKPVKCADLQWGSGAPFCQLPEHLFPFIRWSDPEPLNISELIKENTNDN